MMDGKPTPVRRPALQEASGDTLSPYRSPGQQLLTKLQDSETLRTQRFDATVGGKLRGVRELLASNLQVKHPLRGDAAITSKHDAEVHGLLRDVDGEQVRTGWCHPPHGPQS
jgi:hypothetical protein